MTTVRIDLPDGLVREATEAGLLEPEVLERILREQLRQERREQLAAARSALEADPIAPMTADEIQDEIALYRAERRRATGS